MEVVTECYSFVTEATVWPIYDLLIMLYRFAMLYTLKSSVLKHHVVVTNLDLLPV